MLSVDAYDALSSMTKAQLLAFAQEKGIDGVSGSMTKAQIYATITEAINQ